MDVITLALAKKYANKVAAGYSSVRVDGMNLIFTLNDGSEVTMAVPAPADGKDGADGAAGKDGLSVQNLSIDDDGSLLCHMSDGSVIDAGKVPTVETEQIQSDWDQSNEDENDYIKNRPFYFDEAEKTIFYENEALTGSQGPYGDEVYYIGNYEKELDQFYPNGRVYLSVNGSPFYEGVGNDGMVDVGESVKYTFNDEMYTLNSPYGYHRLILQGDGISAGQTYSVVIKTATETDSIKLMDGTLIDGGAAADWEETNIESVNYIHNKPFYVEKFPRTAYAKSTNTFPIDFNWRFGNYGDDLAAFMTNGKGLVLTVDGVEYGAGVSTGTASYPCFEFDNGNFVLKYGYLSSATTSNGYATYLDYLGSELDKTVAHKVTISTTPQKDIIHQIDKQFIPVDEMLAEVRQKDNVVYNWAEDDGDHTAHIYNKPFGHFYYNTTFSGTETFTQLLESTIPDGQWRNMTDHQNYESTESDWLATLAENDELKQYKWKVTINGVEYLCQWTDAREGFERYGDDSNAIYLFFGEDRKSFFRLGYNATYYYYGLHLELGGKERKIIGDKTITLSYSKYLYERVVKIPDELMPATSRANWNEYNENSLAYIKNKPFGIKPWKSTTLITEYNGTINTRDSVYQLRSSWGEYIWNNLFVTDDEGYTNFRDRQFLITINGEEYIGKFIKDENKSTYGYCYLGQCGIEGSYDYKIIFSGYDQYQQYTDFTFKFGDGSYSKDISLKVELIEDRFELYNNTNITLDSDSNFTDTTLISTMEELKNQDKLYNTPFYITIDGRVYDKTLLSSSDILYLKYRGKNKGNLQFSFTENTIGFNIDSYSKTENISIQIEGNKNEETVVKINEKYLPDTMATKEYVDSLFTGEGTEGSTSCVINKISASEGATIINYDKDIRSNMQEGEIKYFYLNDALIVSEEEDEIIFSAGEIIKVSTNISGGDASTTDSICSDNNAYEVSFVVLGDETRSYSVNKIEYLEKWELEYADIDWDQIINRPFGEIIPQDDIYILDYDTRTFKREVVTEGEIYYYEYELTEEEQTTFHNIGTAEGTLKLYANGEEIDVPVVFTDGQISNAINSIISFETSDDTYLLYKDGSKITANSTAEADLELVFIPKTKYTPVPEELLSDNIATKTYVDNLFNSIVNGDEVSY